MGQRQKQMELSEIAAWAGLVGAIAYGVAFLCFAVVIYRVYLR